MSQAMTRIAIATPYAIPFHCGNSILAERLRVGLSRRGYSVLVYNTRDDTPYNAISFAPDLLHTLNGDKTQPWAELFLSNLSIPWVITLTGTDYNSWCGISEPPPHMARSLDKCSAVTLFHDEAALQLKNVLPSIAHKVWTIPQGVEQLGSHEERSLVRSRLGIEEDQVLFLMAAGIRPVKNMEMAIRAFAKVEERGVNASLLIAGQVMDQQEADRILTLAGTLRSFSYLGDLSPQEVRQVMGAADVYLNTSKNEGMSGAILEAMAEGLPVLASEIPGNAALIRDGENGLLFDPFSLDELVEAMIRLSLDIGLRRTLGENGRRIACERYSLAREMDLYCALYDSLLLHRAP
jgi:glycosyltransferase involved in cell wall biosynthesis